MRQFRGSGMEKWKKILHGFLYPQVWLIILLCAVSAAGLTVVFVMELSEHPIAYAVYVIAFYTISVLSLFFIRILPKQYKAVRQKVYSHPLGNRYMTDIAFKVRISLYIALAINLLYSAYNPKTFISHFLLWTMTRGVEDADPYKLISYKNWQGSNSSAIDFLSGHSEISANPLFTGISAAFTVDSTPVRAETMSRFSVSKDFLIIPSRS